MMCAACCWVILAVISLSLHIWQAASNYRLQKLWTDLAAKIAQVAHPASAICDSISAWLPARNNNSLHPLKLQFQAACAN